MELPMPHRPLLVFLLCASPLAAQHPASLRAALDSARAQNEWTLSQQISICEIPAPPFKEARRAAEMQRRFSALGLADVRLDGIGNVVAVLRGRAARPVVVLSAHLDTVFPEGTDVKVRREGGVFHGPGISDDCRGLAVLLVVAKALREAAVQTQGTLVFLATVGEEGLGNGRGARHFFEKEMPGQVDYFLTVDAADFQIVNRAAGSRRYEVTYRGPGGHSYDNFAMPHPTHALGRAIAKIAAFEVPADPKTTFNVGIVKGGVAVNVVAPSAGMIIDLRSESAEELNRLDARLRQAVQEALMEERARWTGSTASLDVSWDTLGIRPGGRMADSSLIVQAAMTSGRAIGVTPVLTSASTDANIPMSLGVPALAIGIGGHPTGEHSLSEKYDDGPAGYRGPQWVLLIAAVLAGIR
jgi:tripeptide aminopeptidase